MNVSDDNNFQQFTVVLDENITKTPSAKYNFKKEF